MSKLRTWASWPRSISSGERHWLRSSSRTIAQAWLHWPAGTAGQVFPAMVRGSSTTMTSSSMVEREFLRVQQGPEQVEDVLARAHAVRERLRRAGPLVGPRQPAERRQEDLVSEL